MRRTGTLMTHVPFRGAAPLVQELMGERIDVSNSTLPSVLGQIQSGDIRAIAISSPQRNPTIPDVPTLREQGITDADAESWAAFFAPAKVPSTIVDRLSREILAALDKPSAREAIVKMGFTLKPRDPAAFKPYLEQEIATWGEIIKAAGVKQEG
jgi:tripartite-type tricarboxylate transporter receptor subunit TctC